MSLKDLDFDVDEYATCQTIPESVIYEDLGVSVPITAINNIISLFSTIFVDIIDDTLQIEEANKIYAKKVVESCINNINSPGDATIDFLIEISEEKFINYMETKFGLQPEEIESIRLTIDADKLETSIREMDAKIKFTNTLGLTAEERVKGPSLKMDDCIAIILMIINFLVIFLFPIYLFDKIF